MKKLFELSPSLDVAALSAAFAAHGRVQVRDILTLETANEVRSILANGTPWGLAAQAGIAELPGPQQVLHGELQTTAGLDRARALAGEAHSAAAQGDYAFRYARYSLVEGYLGKWNPAGPHDLLLEYLNTPEFLNLVRTITGIGGLTKADGQATFFGPHDFLGYHVDQRAAEGWRVAYVLSMAMDDWKTDWGGYLVFYDDEGDIIHGYRPRFNALNLFAVPTGHAVTYVPPFAPVGRYAITGWFRDQ